MKTTIILPILLLICLSQLLAQPDTLYVSDTETVYLVFPESIALVDIGRASDYLARIEGECVFIKAKDDHAQLTNLLVKTSNQHYFITKIDYAKAPLKNLYDFREEKEFKIEREQEKSKDSKIDLEKIEARLMRLKQETGNVKGLRSSGNHLKLKVTHLQNGRQATYLGIRIANNSSIDYKVDFAGFTLSEKKGRRFSGNNSYQQDITPYIALGKPVIPRYEQASLYYALPLYAMASRGKLEIIIREKGGSRTLRLSIPARKINKAATF